MTRILIILLKKNGYSVLTANSGEEAISYLEAGEVIDLIISDLKMPKIDGIGVLNFLKESGRDIPIVLITAFGSIEVAVQAMKKGAADFITKPFNKDVILHIIRRTLHIEKLENENKFLKHVVHEGNFVYSSRAIFDIMEMVKKIALVNSPVLIMGESGSGKELIAEAIHACSNKSPQSGLEKAFVRINCPAIPGSLLESELFGYMKGSFTGASRDFKGRIRLAEGGTLFLDEIGELPLEIQPKLLRFLEDKTFEPIGSNTTVKVKTRIICATNRNLKERINRGSFREDLFYRINTITIKLPPLRKRKEDILPIAEYFLKKYSRESNKEELNISPELSQALFDYNWPGNIRELRNVIERAVVLTNNKEIKLDDVPADLRQNNSEKTALVLNKLEDSEKTLLLDALKKSDWNITAAAKELGIKRSTIRYRLEKYNLKKELTY
jgi:DNA-binding NtrC family response regulator